MSDGNGQHARDESNTGDSARCRPLTQVTAPGFLCDDLRMSPIRALSASLIWLALGCGGDDESKPCHLGVADSGCNDGHVCEEVTGGMPTCFDPIAIEGKVFDLFTDKVIAGALVAAVDVNNTVATNIVATAKDGTYKLPVPTVRNADGTPSSAAQQLTLHAEAKGYETFPGLIRRPLPIDSASGIKQGNGSSIKSSLTDIGLAPLTSGGGTASIEGKVELAAEHPGVIVVAEAGGVGYATIAGRDGTYAILNLPAGHYAVTAYAKAHAYTPKETDVAAAKVTLDLALSADAAGSISGTVQIVNPGTGTATSVVLFVESTYDPKTGRGIAVPGLRSPESGPPSIMGAFTMTAVPPGKYVVVAGFENDGLVRDPDRCISGTADVHITVTAGAALPIAQTFKITGALDIVGPGATGAEAVTAPPTLTWVDDSGEDSYLVEVFDSSGQVAWMTTIPGVGGGNASVPYAGPLDAGGYYQFRVTSIKTNGGSCELSRTEDLKGVFYVP